MGEGEEGERAKIPIHSAEERGSITKKSVYGVFCSKKFFHDEQPETCPIRFVARYLRNADQVRFLASEVNLIC